MERFESVYAYRLFVYTDMMIYALSKFVSIPSVSSSNTHREDCRQAAIWLRKCLHQLGADASLVSALSRNSVPCVPSEVTMYSYRLENTQTR